MADRTDDSHLDPPVGWQHPQNADCENPSCGWAGQKFRCTKCERTLCMCRHADPGWVIGRGEICWRCYLG